MCVFGLLYIIRINQKSKHAILIFLLFVLGITTCVAKWSSFLMPTDNGQCDCRRITRGVRVLYFFDISILLLSIGNLILLNSYIAENYISAVELSILKSHSSSYVLK